MDIALTPFKRRFVENWRKDVQKHLDEGSICRIVVAQINSDDESPEVMKPAESFPTPTGNRAKHLSKDKTTSDKMAEMAVSSSLHIQSLPSVKFTYTNVQEQKKNSDKLFGGIPVNGRPNFKKDTKENTFDSDEELETKPLVIVDPQLMTPSIHPDLNTQDEKKQKDVRFPLRITSLKPQNESRKYNRLPLFAKCKIQSTEKNSFVVSRSNILKNGKVKNHSFLTLPVRFQVQAQNNERMFQSTESYLMKESSTPVLQRKDSGRISRRMEYTMSPRIASNTVWAW